MSTCQWEKKLTFKVAAESLIQGKYHGDTKNWWCATPAFLKSSAAVWAVRDAGTSFLCWRCKIDIYSQSHCMILDVRRTYWTKKRHHTDTLEVWVIHLRVSMDGLPLWHHQPQPDLHLKHLHVLNFEYTSSTTFFHSIIGRMIISSFLLEWSNYLCCLEWSKNRHWGNAFCPLVDDTLVSQRSNFQTLAS